MINTKYGGHKSIVALSLFTLFLMFYIPRIIKTEFVPNNISARALWLCLCLRCLFSMFKPRCQITEHTSISNFQPYASTSPDYLGSFNMPKA